MLCLWLIMQSSLKELGAAAADEHPLAAACLFLHEEPAGADATVELLLVTLRSGLPD